MNQYEQDVSIDLHHLDKACLDQPALYLKYSEEYTKKRAEYDFKKERLDVLRAETDRRVRDEAIKDGIKLTEAMVQASIMVDPAFQAAQEELIKLNEEVNLINNTKVALEHRKEMIGNLVRLWIAGYFSDIKLPEKEDLMQKARTNALQDQPRLRRKPL